MLGAPWWRIDVIAWGPPLEGITISVIPWLRTDPASRAVDGLRLGVGYRGGRRLVESWGSGWRALVKLLLWPRDHPPSDHGSGDRAALRRVSPDKARETTAGEYVQSNSSATGRNSRVSGA